MLQKYYYLLYRFYQYAEQSPTKGMYGALFLLILTESLIANIIIKIIANYGEVLQDYIQDHSYIHVYWIVIVFNCLFFLTNRKKTEQILQQIENIESKTELQKQKEITVIRWWIYGSLITFAIVVLISPLPKNLPQRSAYEDSVRRSNNPYKYYLKDSDTTDATTLYLEQMQKQKKLKDSLRNDE